MDSAARIVHCLQQAAITLDQPQPPAAAIRDIIGLGLPEAIRRLFGPVSDSLSNDLILAYRNHWHDPQIAASALFPGALSLLDSLQQAGYLLAIATGKGRQGLDQVLLDTKLSAYFQVTRCADECHSKPHPQMVQEIMTDLDTPAADALVIGDTTYDMQMAKNAQVDAAGVAYGVHAPQTLLDQGALVIFETLSEVPDWLNQAD